MLVDSHAHVHQDSYDGDREAVLARAKAAGVTKIICVATDSSDAKLAISTATQHDNLWASVGLHPHDAKLSQAALSTIKQLASEPKVVAIGECGLDYYYERSPRDDQLTAFRAQIELALELGKPLIFHVREAFDDFFATLAEYKNITGVVHSFTGEENTLNKILEQGLFVAFNGIITFTKVQAQLDAAKNCPIDKMLLETDCPFLTPSPHRGQRNEPANVKVIAKFLAQLHGESFDEIATATTRNAEKLFKI